MNQDDWFGKYKQTGINQRYGQIDVTSYDIMVEYWVRQIIALKALYEVLGGYMNQPLNGVCVDLNDDIQDPLDCPFCCNELRVNDFGQCVQCGEQL